jgi:uncharacterized 2Fe-2S/4Fe-4S cluster protein (DUF4445 family)
MCEKVMLTIIDKNQTYQVLIASDTTLLTCIQTIGDIEMDTPCGGNGHCGKCKIQIVQGNVTEPSVEELHLLSTEELHDGFRLACKTFAKKQEMLPLIVKILHKGGKSQVMTGFSSYFVDGPKRFQIQDLTIEPASIEKQDSFLSRVVATIPPCPEFLSLESLKNVQRHMQESTLRCLTDSGKLLHLLADETAIYGCAVDIGTTTVVVYLVNLITGEVIDHCSQLNKQQRFGADVISRIQAVSQLPEGNWEIQKVLLSQLERMIKDVMQHSAPAGASLIEISLVGNTTMLHLLLGIDPASLSVTPFTPVFTQGLAFQASDLGFKAFPTAKISLSPSIASYVGADITAGLYATGCTLSCDPVLFLDIGTNGELALWDGERLYCCSSAAGPAFEGASILFGTGGIEGAISSVEVEMSKEGKPVITCQTIEGAKPIGICGSGIIDVMASLIQLKLIDDTGMMVSPEEDSLGLLFKSEQGIALDLVRSEELSLYFTQKDVREVQLAKAAIAAGIKTLFKESNLTLEKVSKMIIAGGFGNYINVENAQKIGLLPSIPLQKIESVGNAAGKGAVLTLVDPKAQQSMENIVSKSCYIELSTSPVFMDYYIDEMSFTVEEPFANS